MLEEEKKRLALEAVAQEAQKLLEESGKKTGNLIVENEKLMQEIAAVKAIPPPPPSPPKGPVEDPNVVATLRADTARLQNEKEELVRKSDTIEERYKNGDLVCSTFPNLRQAVDRTDADRSREGLGPYHQGRGTDCPGTTARSEVERDHEGGLAFRPTALREDVD
jgi:hypothetical protein